MIKLMKENPFDPITQRSSVSTLGVLAEKDVENRERIVKQGGNVLVKIALAEHEQDEQHQARMPRMALEQPRQRQAPAQRDAPLLFVCVYI